jgi:isoquinoline 1-oxidoreductase
MGIGTFQLRVNGEERVIDASPDRPLLWVLRDELRLTGAKPGCGEGVCGACTVLVNGEAVRSCVTPLGSVADADVTTVESIAGDDPDGVIAAISAARAPQCGFCMPGMVMAMTGALRAGARDRSGVLAALEGNICRCGTYTRLTEAVDTVLGAPAAPGAATVLPPVRDLLPRPPRPWDLTEPAERDWFGTLGDGLVVVLRPETLAQGRGRAWWTVQGGAWLHVGSEGRVTAFTGKVDVGQDNGTALALLVAEELHVGPAAVRLVAGDTDVCPLDMGTFGSRGMPDGGSVLRVTAASAREVLIRLAAERLEAAAADLVADAGSVRSRDGARSIGFGDLVTGRQQVEFAALNVKTTPPADWRTAGTPTARPVARDAAAGRLTYVSDLALPGMLHGRVLQRPAPGAELEGIDEGAIAARTDIQLVRSEGVVGVVGPTSSAVDAALAALRPRWSAPTAAPSEPDLAAWLRANPADAEGWDGPMDERTGNVEVALAQAHATLSATYTAAFLAHVPMETRSAVAAWDGDRVTIWVGTQRPFGTREHVAEALGLDEAAIRVIVPATGAAFGGKHGGDVAVEGAILARAVGRPVSVRWSRHDEFIGGYLRPAAVVDLRANVANGRIAAWDWTTWNAGSPGIEPPYAVPNQRIRSVPTESPIAQGPYRALGATANTFAREAAVDELAAMAGVDPVDFRLANTSDERLAAVLGAVADHVRDGAAGAPVGFACATEKDGYVATAAELSVEADGTVRLHRLVTALDCGAIVNPDNLRNQVEGATVMALGGALFERIRFEDGTITNGTLTDYRVPRFSDVPRIEVLLIDRRDKQPAGAGEVAMITVAPAIANAIAAASGRRLRTMPLLPDGRLPL